MKLLLIQPPVQDFYDTDIRLQPIGLSYLKSAIHQYLPGVEVVIKDYHRGHGRRTLPIPKELAYLKDYYAVRDQSPFSTFHHYYHFGAPFETIAEDVAQEKPDMVGISCLFSPYYRETLAVAEVIKNKISVPILAGGSHVSAMPEQILQSPFIDFIIRGEGEKPLVEFLRSWQNGRQFETVANLGFKQNGEIILNEISDNFSIEELPSPDLSWTSGHAYTYEKKPLSFVITSRSCPHRCSFCSVHQTFGFRFRRRSTANVLSEIKARYQEGIRVFDFEDDNLTYYKDEMKELCRELIKTFPDKDVEFVAMNGISYLSLDAELLTLMKDAGFTRINIALVSSDITVRETTKRPHTIPKYLEVVEAASRLGLDIVSYQILGLPNETLDSMIQTLVFNARLPVLLGASMFYLTPNSPIAKDFPSATDSDVFKSRLTAMAVETENFKRDDIYTLFITTRIINFLKGFRFGTEDEENASRFTLHASQTSTSSPIETANDISLKTVLATASKSDKRSALGAEILQRLFDERILHAATADGFVPLKKFKPDVFFKVWNQLDWIGMQSGSKINVTSHRK